MKARKVTLVMENPNDPQVVEHLRYWYGTMLRKLVTELMPRWEKDAEASMQGIGSGVIKDHLTDMIGKMNYATRIFAQPGDDIVCETRFGHYCPQRDAVILWISKLNKHDEFFRGLFDLEPKEPLATEQFYLVFSFGDIRIATVVLNTGTWLKLPEEMTTEQHDEIFEAAGIPKPARPE